MPISTEVELRAVEGFDEPVRLVPPRVRVAVAVVALVVVAGAFWACFGSLPRTVGAPGVLTRPEGSFTLQSPIAGQITGVFVREGATFAVDAPLFTVMVGNTTQTVKAIGRGRATALLGEVGQILDKGDHLAVIERMEEGNSQLVAVLYVSPDKVGLVAVGQEVDLSLHAAPAQQYGVLRGQVQSIDRFPSNREQISEFLGDSQLGAAYSQGGQPFKVVVRLMRADTISGFAWSTRQGPSFQIDSRTSVDGTFHLAPMRPLDWVIS
ncbi:HlyD family efflux transporter periplasmic adaptor subunit [Lentzea alba]|uniref:HlyD family efflux transporter periplasmic adaptor subunit n=1 Tax=Lentzea alba TaxID=2714351 RepID=UPI0039BFBAC4